MPGDLKSGIPAAVEIPAPLITMMFKAMKQNSTAQTLVENYSGEYSHENVSELTFWETQCMNIIINLIIVCYLQYINVIIIC